MTPRAAVVVAAVLATSVVGSTAPTDAAVAGAVPGGTPASAMPRTLAPIATSAFRPIEPCRAADTRSGHGIQAIAEDRIRTTIAGRCAVPAEAVAAAVTVTAVDADGAGHVTVWPAGEPLPEASMVNVDAGEIRANGAIVALGAGGGIDVRSSTPADLIVDVTGWFEPVTSAADGRFVPVPPTRLLDTRDHGVPLGAGETTVVSRPRGVPPDAVALAVNVTTTGPNAPGFITLHRSGDERPDASALNTDGWDQTRSAASIAPIDEHGLAVYSDVGGHVIVDVTGWFTGPSATESNDGLFVPTSPLRLADTRHGDPLWPGGSIEVAPIEGAAAMALNVTMVHPADWNFVTAYPARTAQPGTSSVNVDRRGAVAANFAIVAQSGSGIAMSSHDRADVLVDLAGWFTGAPSPFDGAPPQNVRPPVCAADTSAAAISALLRSDDLFHGADYQRTIALPDGRTLWLFQDMFAPTRTGGHHIHNGAAVQDGACFDLLHGGSYSSPAPFLFGADTARYRRWFWPLGGTMGADESLYVFMAEMHERSAEYLGHTEPAATWMARLDPSTLQVIETRRAPNSSAALYGWSVVDHGDHTYLYAHCYRQFGFDPLVFTEPIVYMHDLSCADRVTVGRVPRGELWATPGYWDGSTWTSDARRAVPVIPRSSDRRINPTQVHHDGTRFVALTKEGDWWGDTIYVDVADNAQGPWRTIGRLPLTPRCDDCNTYFASFIGAPSPGLIRVGLSNNVFRGGDRSAYFPMVFDLAV